VRHQRKGYWCGIASIANALEVLGIRRTQREIAKLCHVTPAAGTNETEMMRALLANGLDVDEWSSTEARPSVEWLYHHVSCYGPAVLCVDNDDHWVTVIGHAAVNFDVRFLVFDPSRNTGNEVHTGDSLAARWVNADGVYYGIGMRRPR
jgi:hypothetical protein